MDKTLVIYYSFTGNSKKVAEYVKGKLDADILELEPATPFSSDYDEVVDEWQNNDIKRDVDIKQVTTNFIWYINNARVVIANYSRLCYYRSNGDVLWEV